MTILIDARPKDAANKALEMHGHELEPNLPLNVFISDPGRRKERSDQAADEKEIYVAGLSKFTTKTDLENIFSAVSHCLSSTLVMSKAFLSMEI